MRGNPALLKTFESMPARSSDIETARRTALSAKIGCGLGLRLPARDVHAEKPYAICVNGMPRAVALLSRRGTWSIGKAMIEIRFAGEDRGRRGGGRLLEQEDDAVELRAAAIVGGVGEQLDAASTASHFAKRKRPVPTGWRSTSEVFMSAGFTLP